MKKNGKAVSVMKEDRQEFQVMLGGRSEPRRGISVPCYISAMTLRQNPKHHFHNY